MYQESCLPPSQQHRAGNLASAPEIWSTLLRHTGLLCSHAVAAVDPPADQQHLQRVLYLLEAAVQDQDQTSVLCLLAALQSVFRTTRGEQL